MNITSANQGSSYDPNNFGPALWFTLHNSATTYPDYPTFESQQEMKQLLKLLLHWLIPCFDCKTHWFQNLENFNLDNVVKSRENLFNFYVHSHNNVNKRNKKPLLSIQEAKNVYGFYNVNVGSLIKISYTTKCKNKLNITSTSYGYSYDPDNFGPALWFTLHNSATTYPDYPTLESQQEMKQLLKLLHWLIPCTNNNFDYKIYWLENLKFFNLDNVVKSRENLFNFYVQFHNFINKKNDKPLLSIQEAKNVYGFYRPGFGSSIRISYST